MEYFFGCGLGLSTLLESSLAFPPKPELVATQALPGHLGASPAKRLSVPIWCALLGSNSNFDGIFQSVGTLSVSPIHLIVKKGWTLDMNLAYPVRGASSTVQYLQNTRYHASRN